MSEGSSSSLSPAPQLTVVEPGGGTDHWVLGDRVTTKLGPQHTGGTFTVAEITVGPGSGPPPHVHEREDEMFFVLDGTFSFLRDGRTYRGTAGSCVYLPKRIVHTFKNVGDRPGRFLAFATPCGFERFVAAVGSRTCPTSPALDPADVHRVLARAPEFGLDMNPAMPAPPTDAGAFPDGNCRWVLGESVTIKQTAADTGGRFTVAEVQTWPGGGPPPHVHRALDEMFYVIDGTYDFLLEGRWHTATAGTTVFVPRGTPHTYRNAGSAPGRLLDVHTPGGFESFFEEAGVPAPDRTSRPAAPAAAPDQAALLALLDRHGMDVPPR